MNRTIQEVVNCQNLLGECPIWDARSQTLWWTSILDKKLFYLDPSTRACNELDLPERLGSFALTSDPNQLLMAFESGIALFDYKSNQINWLTKLEKELAHNRLNDGRCDRQGRFWVGSMNENEKNRQLTGNLYRCGASHKTSRQVATDNQSTITLETELTETKIAISNGLAFSPDSRKLYFADSFQRLIWEYDFDPSSGSIANRRVFVKTEEGASPDGSAVDSQGNLWNAQWGASQIVCYSPQGTILEKISTPVSQPSCIAFGGRDLKTLYITSARIGLDSTTLAAEPLAGSVLSVEVSVQGIEESLFEL